MPISEAVGLACSEYMGERARSGRGLLRFRTRPAALSFHDDGKCPTFSEMASFSRFAKNRLSRWGSGLGRVLRGWTHGAGLRFRHPHFATPSRPAAMDKSLSRRAEKEPNSLCPLQPKVTPNGGDALTGDFGGHWCPQASPEIPEVPETPTIPGFAWRGSRREGLAGCEITKKRGKMPHLLFQCPPEAGFHGFQCSISSCRGVSV
jgi:hypothetical protein